MTWQQGWRDNRTYPVKEDTFVLDFVNDPTKIRFAFQLSYKQTIVGEHVDHRQLYRTGPTGQRVVAF